MTDKTHASRKSERENQRLTRESEFQYVKRKGRKCVSRLCVMQVAQAPDGMHRQAIVISRYFSPKAVVRNRARRLLRVALRKLEPVIRRPFWIVLRPRQPIKAVNAHEVTDDVQHLCRRLKLLEGADGRNG